IREGTPFNEGEIAPPRNMVAILGRMAAYTAQQINYEDALTSKTDLTPPHLDWKEPLPAPRVPIPGVTKFV
ncbi:MAG: gfo/Idh/MocA family oxidoreductase, partial [Verrucomicrobia bacterium]|nr:gfo/Idh/MocA family oxidoreductase [Verrucomicrobiota bacterium]